MHTISWIIIAYGLGSLLGRLMMGNYLFEGMAKLVDGEANHMVSGKFILVLSTCILSWVWVYLMCKSWCRIIYRMSKGMSYKPAVDDFLKTRKEKQDRKKQ